MYCFIAWFDFVWLGFAWTSLGLLNDVGYTAWPGLVLLGLVANLAAHGLVWVCSGMVKPRLV